MSSRRQSLVGLIETVELLETFAAMGWMLDGLLDPGGVTVGPMGGQMAWIWTAGYQDVDDFGQFADATFFFEKL